MRRGSQLLVFNDFIELDTRVQRTSFIFFNAIAGFLERRASRFVNFFCWLSIFFDIILLRNIQIFMACSKQFSLYYQSCLEVVSATKFAFFRLLHQRRKHCLKVHLKEDSTIVFFCAVKHIQYLWHGTLPTTNFR